MARRRGPDQMAGEAAGAGPSQMCGTDNPDQTQAPDLAKLKRYFTEARDLTYIYRTKALAAIDYYDSDQYTGQELTKLQARGQPAIVINRIKPAINSTGYQFNLNQGLEAVTQSKAAAGLLNSGATLKALDAYATGEADKYGQQYEQNLAGEVTTGVGAVNALTGAGTNYANQVSANNNSAATAQGNAAIAGANLDTSLISNALSAYAFGRGQSSFGGGGSGGAPYNAFAPGG